MTSSWMARVCACSTLLLLGACAEEAPPAPPPPEVGVYEAQPKAIDDVEEVPGRVQAVRTAQVRARVDGIIQRRLYVEGSDVEAGQKLFQIDPRELRANLNSVKASLVRAEATAANAAQDVDRYKGLVEDQAISQQEYDAAVARLRTAQADVAQMKAQLESAELSLSYTIVNAPIAGRAGRAQVTEGALVSAASATLLTTIEQLDPVYVNFSQSSAALLSLRRDIAQGAIKVPELDRMEVTLLLEDGREYRHRGHLNFLDLSIDQATGTVAVRAEFPNPERILLPGQFVRARIEIGVRAGGYLIPQRAVQLSPDGATVLIVDENNMARSREIELGELQGASWIVLNGLTAGDRVIVEGLQKVQPDAPVRIGGDQRADAAQVDDAAQADDAAEQ